MLFFKNCLQIKENRSFNSAEFQWYLMPWQLRVIVLKEAYFSNALLFSFLFIHLKNKNVPGNRLIEEWKSYKAQFLIFIWANQYTLTVFLDTICVVKQA